MPICKLNYENDVCFQKDNPPINKASNVQQFMKICYINILLWPNKSPSLNMVTDVLKLLSNDIYNIFQFKYVMAVKYIIFNKFNYERRDDMKVIYQTIRRRFNTVLEKKGAMFKEGFLI